MSSSDEVLDKIKKIDNTNHLCASTDVESLFTNVPVHETIKIILENVYNHKDIHPPNIDKDFLKELLPICTTCTPFEFDKEIYKKINEVSMG